MAKTTTQQVQANKIYSNLLIITAVVLMAMAGLALWLSSFTTNMVQKELSAQKIYFPEKGSAQLDPAKYPGLQQYAGQLVDTAPEAKAYANEYIGEHLKHTANGKVYAEVSAEAMKDPTNAELQKQRQTLFMGETLRSILLTTGYAYGTIGYIASITAASTFFASLLLFGAAFIFRTKK